MQVIPPVTFTDSILTSSTVQETVAATYSGGTTYALGAYAGAAPVTGQAQVIWRSLQNGNTGNAQTEGAWWTAAGSVYPAYAGGTTYAALDYAQDNTNHLIYRSLVGSNLGNALTDTTKWQLIGPTNRWAALDYDRNTKSSAPLSLTYVFAPGQRCNSLGLGGIRANSYSLTVTSVIGGGTVYSASGSLNTRLTLGWYDYFFGEFTTKESLAFFDVPPYTDAIWTLTLTATSGNAELGSLMVGTYVYLGATQYTAASDALNFSLFNRDADTGEAVLTRRRTVPKTAQVLVVEKSRVNRVRQVREDLNGVPAFWYGIGDDTDDYFDSLALVGLYKQFSIDVNYPEQAIVRLEIEGY